MVCRRRLAMTMLAFVVGEEGEILAFAADRRKVWLKSRLSCW